MRNTKKQANKLQKLFPVQWKKKKQKIILHDAIEEDVEQLDRVSVVEGEPPLVLEGDLVHAAAWKGSFKFLTQWIQGIRQEQFNAIKNLKYKFEGRFIKTCASVKKKNFIKPFNIFF
jgi:NAD kinase